MEVAAEGSGKAISPVAFAEFYDDAAKRVFRYLARSVLGDRSIAEDLTQETFTAVVVAAQAGRPEALSLPWVMGVARHKLVDHYRRVARNDRERAACAATSELCELDRFESSDPFQVLEIMRDLSPEHRIVLILKYVDGLTAQEVAVALDRSLDATNSLLGRARRAFIVSLTEKS
jgi:RNA polymerase sigma-70 factor (ECF subfamily)